MPASHIADFLRASGLLTAEQLQRAQELSQKKRCSLEEAVFDLKFLAKLDLYGAVADQLRVPYVELEEYLPDPKIRDLLPVTIARRYRAFPLFRIQSSLVVALANPADLEAIDALRQASGCLIEGVLAPEGDIFRALEGAYGAEGETERYIKELARKPQALLTQAPEGAEGPIAKLAEMILADAVRGRASDIHVEPEEDLLRIRVRIDGILHEIPAPSKSFEASLISRLKVLGNMDIAESRIPQDGHFQINVEDRRVDIRMATLPTIHGENVVLRILDPAGLFLGLEQLGFNPASKEAFEAALMKHWGIILCVGPTGHGKTTTLYSALNRISSIDRNIITLEDPVEYRLGLIRQVQVNPKTGITFATGLRSILRQDPDVIMVGEIRDLETAEMAIQAALTGHLVLSTLHTGDASSTVTRLVNMGIEPFLISAALTCVVAIRLVRLVCELCKTWYAPPQAVAGWLASRLKMPQPGLLKLAKGAGCLKCRGTGFRGRTGIFEVMVLDDELKAMILSASSAAGLREAAREKGMRLLWEEGMSKVLEGLTTLEEVSRVTEEGGRLPAGAP